MWCDALNSKPVHESENMSVPVLVWIEKFEYPTWGYYNYLRHEWMTEAQRHVPATAVKYFAYIDNPYK
jgi:hypothetical protein